MALNRKVGTVALALACLAVAGGTAWSLFGQRSDSRASDMPGETTASIGAAPRTVGSSGLPIPRFVSIKAEKVNVRRGPSSDHAVSWVFNRKGVPVEIVAEFENWRRVRDSDGEEGWILQNMLSGKRTVMIAPWRKGQVLALRAQPKTDAGLVAELAAGVIAEVEDCGGDWCHVDAAGYDGWVEQSMLWGVYPGEVVD
jgi:SH3-like domain-containing protein